MIKFWSIAFTLSKGLEWEYLIILTGALAKRELWQHVSLYQKDRNLVMKHAGVSLQGINSVSVTEFHQLSFDLFGQMILDYKIVHSFSLGDLQYLLTVSIVVNHVTRNRQKSLCLALATNTRWIKIGIRDGDWMPLYPEIAEWTDLTSCFILF